MVGSFASFHFTSKQGPKNLCFLISCFFIDKRAFLLLLSLKHIYNFLPFKNHSAVLLFHFSFLIFSLCAKIQHCAISNCNMCVLFLVHLCILRHYCTCIWYRSALKSSSSHNNFIYYYSLIPIWLQLSLFSLRGKTWDAWNDADDVDVSEVSFFNFFLGSILSVQLVWKVLTGFVKGYFGYFCSSIFFLNKGIKGEKNERNIFLQTQQQRLGIFTLHN